VLSHAAWQTRFRGDPAIVGEPLILNGRPFDIIGVAAQGFQGTTLGIPNELWVPAAMYNTMNPTWAMIDPLHSSYFRSFELIGRLKPGVPEDYARSQLTSVSEELHTEGVSAFTGARLIPVRDSTMGVSGRSEASGYMRLLLVIVGLVLLIACANVANMFVARAQYHRKEFAIRGALGAGRWRLMRQLITESLVFAVIGGAFGLIMSLWVADILLALMPETELLAHGSVDLSVDARVYAFTLGIALLAGIFLGAMATGQAVCRNLVPALKDQPDTLTGRRGALTLSNLLVSGQVATSLLLLVSAGLLLQTLTNMRRTNLGFDPDNLLLASFDLRRQGYTLQDRRSFHEQVLQRAGVLPGVVSVGLANAVPPHGKVALSLRLEGSQHDAEGIPDIYCNIVSPEYFPTMRIPVLRGRAFQHEDTHDTRGVIVVNATMAKKYWGDADSALGRVVHMADLTFDVIGVVGDGIYHTLRDQPRPLAYFPIAQLHKYTSTQTLIVRTTDHPMKVASTLRAVVRGLDPALPLFDIEVFDDRLSAAVSQERMLAWLSGVFSILALVLTATGLYGVMAYAVSRRVREIGIRRALGAQNGTILGMVLRRGLLVTGAGMVVGTAGALVATRGLQSRLHEIVATDPVTFAGALVVLSSVALLACYIPARRATKVDPMVALRCE
jgi:predicted permease